VSAETALAAALLLLPAFAAASDVGTPLLFPAPPAVTIDSTLAGDVLFETAPSDDQAEDSDAILFHGEYTGKDLRFEVSRKLPDGSWSPWAPAFVQRYDNGRYWGRASLPSGRGGVRLRALSAGRR
jgi:hypothetical protein